MKYCARCADKFDSPEWVCPKCGCKPVVINGYEAHAPELAYGGGGFKEEYFENLAAVEAKNFWFEARNKLIRWAFKKNNSGCSNFLEVGCGTGFVLSGIAAESAYIKLHGSEIFVAGFSYAEKRVPQAHFMQMDARKIPFFEEFDMVGAFDVLEHIEEDDAALLQFYQSLKKEGVLILSVPQHKWLWSAADDYACHARRYEKKELHLKLQKAGFVIKKSTSFVGFLLPAMMASRWMKKNKPYDPSAELRIPSLLNNFFKMIMYLEIGLIRMGVNIPFGGSRLVIAKKS